MSSEPTVVPPSPAPSSTYDTEDLYGSGSKKGSSDESEESKMEDNSPAEDEELFSSDDKEEAEKAGAGTGSEGLEGEEADAKEKEPAKGEEEKDADKEEEQILWSLNEGHKAGRVTVNAGMDEEEAEEMEEKNEGEDATAAEEAPIPAETKDSSDNVKTGMGITFDAKTKWGISIGSLKPKDGTNPLDMDGTGAQLIAVTDVARQKGLERGDELTHILGFPVGDYPTKLIKLMIDGARGKKNQTMEFKFSNP